MQLGLISLISAHRKFLKKALESFNQEVTKCTLLPKGCLKMKLTQTPVFVASQRQESQVKFVSQLVCGQVLDLGPKHGQNTTCTK